MPRVRDSVLEDSPSQLQTPITSASCHRASGQVSAGGEPQQRPPGLHLEQLEQLAELREAFYY